MTPSKELKFEIWISRFETNQEVRNPKSEALNPKQIQMTEIPMIKNSLVGRFLKISFSCFGFCALRFSALFRISCFGIRACLYLFRISCLVLYFMVSCFTVVRYISPFLGLSTRKNTRF